MISFTTGLGYFRVREEMSADPYSSHIEANRSYETIMSVIRLPLQVNYHILKDPTKTDIYLKAVYTNGFWFDKTTHYENDGTTIIDKSIFYYPSIGIGIGGIFLKHKPVGIIVEGMIEQYLRFESFRNATWYSLKIGVII